MSVAVEQPRASWAEPVRLLVVRTGALAIVELQKLRHDNTELITRVVQPVLWLLVFGQIFSRIRAIPTGDLSYLEYLTPGILAQSALFVSIFVGIQIIWDRDAGILTKVMVTPTPRAAIVLAKAFSAGIRGLAPVVVLVPVSLLLGVSITVNPLKLIAAAVALMLGAGFFACLSMAIAGVAQARDRLMGIGQLMTMPLFFASNALYPIEIMPTLAAGDQPGQPADVPGQRPARPAGRRTGEPLGGLRRAPRGRRRRRSRRSQAHGQAGPLTPEQPGQRVTRTVRGKHRSRCSATSRAPMIVASPDCSACARGRSANTRA